MAHGMGANAVMYVVDEASYGVTPASGFRRLPFVSHSMGEERGLIEDDQLGFGREGLDPVYDVAANDGDITVPVDDRAFGVWLRSFFGNPVTTGAGPYTHVFTSGAAALPSRSIERGNPDVPAFSVDYGAALNQIRIPMSRGGMLNAVLSFIAQGETAIVASSVAGTPTDFRGERFEQATGVIERDGVALGNIVDADLSLSNGFEKIEVIRPDGRIGGVVPGPLAVALRIRARFDTLALYNAATDKTPVNLTKIGWSRGSNSLSFALPRVFLPRVKRPIQGPRGIIQEINCIASGQGGNKAIATLVNAVATYTS
jgi:hypothetical protein